MSIEERLERLEQHNRVLEMEVKELRARLNEREGLALPALQHVDTAELARDIARHGWDPAMAKRGLSSGRKSKKEARQ